MLSEIMSFETQSKKSRMIGDEVNWIAGDITGNDVQHRRKEESKGLQACSMLEWLRLSSQHRILD